MLVVNDLVIKSKDESKSEDHYPHEMVKNMLTIIDGFERGSVKLREENQRLREMCEIFDEACEVAYSNAHDLTLSEYNLIDNALDKWEKMKEEGR